MTGTIQKMINSILDQRSKGNLTIRISTQTKLILKGINPEKFSAASADDPAVIEKLKTIAKELGVTL
jgi:hypothetical protein